MKNKKAQIFIATLIIMLVVSLSSTAIIIKEKNKKIEIIPEENFKLLNTTIEVEEVDYVGEEVKEDEVDWDDVEPIDFPEPNNNSEDEIIIEEIIIEEEEPDEEQEINPLVLVEVRHDGFIVGEYFEYEVDIKNIGNETLSCWESTSNYWYEDIYYRSLTYNPKEFLPDETITFYGKTNYPLHEADRYTFGVRICKGKDYEYNRLIIDTLE